MERTPVPDHLESTGTTLGELTRAAASVMRGRYTGIETSHSFQLPSLLQLSDISLSNRFVTWQSQLSDADRALLLYQSKIDKLCYSLYGIKEEDQSILEMRQENMECEVGEEEDLDTEDVTLDSSSAIDKRSLLADIPSYAVGCIFGRWDIRIATGDRRLPELPDPFDPLPVCSPGMLTSGIDLSAKTLPGGYPLRVNWEGIIVDDPDHPHDIIRRVRDVHEEIWKDRADAIQKEACEILGEPNLRDYFRKPGAGGFWDDHVRRYCKGRRKAPIYWLLQSSKKNYALWIYYHRLDKDILFKALLNYVEPKIRREESRLDELRSQKTALGPAAKGAKKLDKDIDRQDAFLSELRDFEDKLRRAANLHLDPDLNDGVVLNIAPLRELVPWKEARSYWDDLLDGKYEWSSIGRQLREKGLVSGS